MQSSHRYPFDTQRCSMTFTVAGVSKEFVRLIANDHEYLGPKELTQYFIRGSRIHLTNLTNDDSAAVLDIMLGRRLLGTFLTVFLPTILLNIIGHTTNFFKNFFFEAAVTVNLTVMLVLATLFISVSKSLPQTSYIKMVDVWLIVNLFMPFIEVILRTWKVKYRSWDSVVAC